MKNLGKGTRVAALVLAGGLAGYLLGPPIANAATAGLVVIKSASSTNKAIVKNGRLQIDTEAQWLNGLPANFVLTAPWGEYVLLADNDASITKSGSGTITGINFDVQASTGDVTLVLRKGTSAGSGMVIWEGTIPAGPGNLSYTFEDGIYIVSGGFNVTWTATSGSPTVQYQIYGDNFGVTSSARRAVRP